MPKVKVSPKNVLKHLPVDEPELFLNRELAWLNFNERVLSEAEQELNPILERLKFVAIFHSNLDEFFMVRINSLMRLIEKEARTISERGEWGDEDPEETLDEVVIKVRSCLLRCDSLMTNALFPQLAEIGISKLDVEDLSRSESQYLDEYFEKQVFPVLTPLGLDPAHPFPYLSNLALNLAVDFEETSQEGDPLLAFIEVPQKLNRLIFLPSRGKKHKFVLMEDLIQRNLALLFPWTTPKNAHVFRVTRNLDYHLLDVEVKDLMKSIESELKDRAQKIVVRLEVDEKFPPALRNKLRVALDLDPADVYETRHAVNPRDFLQLTRLDVDGKHKDTIFVPRNHSRLQDDRDIFEVIREKDVLLHHPFESFGGVLEFLQCAAEDPNVLAIKQTLYRTGGDSPIIDALVRAAENGKQVTAVIELKARFDEHNNIHWAKRLERSGAHVVFGFIDLKTHAKCALVVRKEGNHLNRYVHLSTGNYNTSTARLYTDIGFLSADPALANDITVLFNLLTGFNILSNGNQNKLASKAIKFPEFEKIFVAPFDLREQIIKWVEAERKFAIDGIEAHIVLKMNSLVDAKLIQALYKASQRGVKIDLIVRGVCTLRPGITGVSENIRVISVIDRFLEHSRVLWFKNNGNAKLFLSSADFMERNMDRRIEVVWPVEDADAKEKISSILGVYLSDNKKSHTMNEDGSYRTASERSERNARSASTSACDVRAQVIFMDGLNHETVRTLSLGETTRFKAKKLSSRKI
jgi:polyphosphate kinase